MMTFYDWLNAALAQFYEEERILKESDRGRVALLRHREQKRRMIRRDFTGSAEAYSRLLVRRHAALPMIYEVAHKDGRVLVLEEYIRGDSLDEILRGSLLSTPEAVELLLQVCDGLSALHSQRIIHRDVKPENILLEAGGTIKLIDFDAARVSKPAQSADTVVLGTQGFAAPEQFGLAQTDARADIFSVGILINVMLTGEHPSKAHCAGPLAAVVDRCTMTDPGKRYQTAAALKAALQRVGRGGIAL